MRVIDGHLSLSSRHHDSQPVRIATHLDLRAKEAAKIECGKAHFKAPADGTSSPKF
jgi:hypothetical protein